MKTKRKKAFWISVLALLLPSILLTLFSHLLPDKLPMHANFAGTVDSWASPLLVIWLLPGLLFLAHLLLVGITYLDPNSKQQNPKIAYVLYAIAPVLNLAMLTWILGVAFHWRWTSVSWIPIPLALLFIALGNYFPKLKQNQTMGIRVSWTLNNEENWLKTHRMAGHLWVICGILLLFSAFWPVKLMVAALVLIVPLLAIVPIVYSWRLAEAQKKAGTYRAVPSTKQNKAVLIGALVFVALIAIVIVVLLFSGSIHLQFGAEALEIKASYWSDLTLPYADIESARLETALPAGDRLMGYGSIRLGLGHFRNETLGDYSRYCYNACPSAVVLKTKNGFVVFNGATEAETKQLWQDLQQHLPKR